MKPISIGGGADSEEHQAVSDLREALRGRRVIDVRDNLPTCDPGWSDHGSITLVFDDGAELKCGGWGHDAWGPEIEYAPSLRGPSVPQKNPAKPKVVKRVEGIPPHVAVSPARPEDAK